MKKPQKKATKISGGALAVLGALLIFPLIARATGSSTSTFSTASSTLIINDTELAPPAASIEIAPQILPDAAVGVPYSQDLSVVSTEGGPFFWTVDGDLPGGLSLNATSSDSESQLSGVPSAAGSSAFTVAVTNQSVAATQAYVLTVDPGVSPPVPAVSITAVTPSTSLQSQIDAVSSGITQLESQLDSGTSLGPTYGDVPIFYRDLTLGDVGPDVVALQRFLNNEGYMVAASGPGSPGDETDYFGLLTQAALARWQAATGILPALGYFGVTTRGQISALDDDL